MENLYRKSRVGPHTLVTTLNIRSTPIPYTDPVSNLVTVDLRRIAQLRHEDGTRGGAVWGGVGLGCASLLKQTIATSCVHTNTAHSIIYDPL